MTGVGRPAPPITELWRSSRDRYRAAWLSARNRAQAYAQRYRYERKLCDAADLRATKAIRAQLRAEAQRDEARAALGQGRAEVLYEAAAWFDQYDTDSAALLRRMAMEARRA